MKRVILIMIVITLGCWMSTGMLSAQERNGPKIEVKEHRFDFGKIVQGQQAVHVFEFRNGGDEPLEIQKVQTS